MTRLPWHRSRPAGRLPLRGRRSRHLRISLVVWITPRLGEPFHPCNLGIRDAERPWRHADYPAILGPDQDALPVITTAPRVHWRGFLFMQIGLTSQHISRIFSPLLTPSSSGLKAGSGSAGNGSGCRLGMYCYAPSLHYTKPSDRPSLYRIF